jgi:hypothetical protein
MNAPARRLAPALAALSLAAVSTAAAAGCGDPSPRPDGAGTDAALPDGDLMSNNCADGGGRCVPLGECVSGSYLGDPNLFRCGADPSLVCCFASCGPPPAFECCNRTGPTLFEPVCDGTTLSCLSGQDEVPVGSCLADAGAD